MNAVTSVRAAASQIFLQPALAGASVCDFPGSGSCGLAFTCSRPQSTLPSPQRRLHLVPQPKASLPTADVEKLQPTRRAEQTPSRWGQLRRQLRSIPRKPVLSVLGLVGGLATPVLVSSGGGAGSGDGNGSGEGGGGGGGDGFHWDKGHAQAAAAEEEEEEEEEEEGEELEEAEKGAVVPRVEEEEEEEEDDGEDILADIAAFDDIHKRRSWPATFYSPFQVSSGEAFGVDELREKYVGEKLTPEVLDKLTSDFTYMFGEYLEGITMSYERSNRDPSLKENEVRLIFNWREPELPAIRGLRVVGSSLITEEMQRVLLKDLQEETPMNARTLAMFRERLQASFKAAGLEGGLESMNFVDGNILQLKFGENRVGNITFQFLHADGKTSYNEDMAKCMPVGFQAGDVMKSWDALGPLQEGILAMGVFSRVGVGMTPAGTDSDKTLDLEIQCELAQQKAVDGELEWQFIPNQSGRPTLYSLEPGGTIMYQHSHFGGWNKTFSASIGTSNFFSPMEDVGFNVSYKHLNVFGPNDKKHRRLEVDAFNGRKESAIHTPSPNLEGIPSITVDRAGVRAVLTEFPFFSKEIHIDYGATFEEVNSRGEDYQFRAEGSRILDTGEPDFHGPPTSLGVTGSDKQLFLHGSIDYNNVTMEKEVMQGTRALFTMEQGTWIGTENPMFNRWTASGTHYFKLGGLPSLDTLAPPSAVVHAKAGDTIGDLAPYDAHPLGGPFTVRSYGVGDLGAARRFLELAAEVRYPIKAASVYGFAEYATDLGSGKEVPGNPNEFYRRPGHGLAYGAGVDWCGVKLEYQVDNHKKKGSLVLRHGGRF